MRRSTVLFATALFLLPALTACEGPTGPAGTSGVAGSTGPAGPVGPAGQNANENCTQCHTNNTELFAKQVQYGASIHRIGGNFERGNSASCASCHAHEGFADRVAHGMADESSIAPENPSPINCRTCHQIHTTYTSADYALTTTAPVTLMFGGGTFDQGDANLCASCHQGRPVTGAPVLGGPDVTITSSRYGVHHGPQSLVLSAQGAYEFTGSKVVPSNPNTHGKSSTNPDGCVSCHMAAAYGAQAGGHTWNMAYDYHGAERGNYAGCNTSGCHAGDISTFDYEDVQTEVEELLADLAVELKRVGVMRAGDTYAATGKFKADLAAAYINWQMFEEDRSLGVHSPRYVVSVLTNTIEKMKTY